MRTIAICTNTDVCTGLRLVGVDSYFAASEEELAEVVDNIDTTDIGIIVICENFASSPSLKNFRENNPQILAGFLPI